MNQMMKKLASALLLALAMSTSHTASAQGFQNPIIPGFYPDPSVLRVGEDYYLINSTFQFFPGVPLWHSRDLVHWEQLGNVLDRSIQLPLNGSDCWSGIYAPTIRFHEGRFYMITTNVGHVGNFVVMADVPTGAKAEDYPQLFREGKIHWGEPIWLTQEGIDPSLLFEDGKCYMTSNPDGAIWLCELDADTGEQLTESRMIWEGTGGRHPEAPHLYKINGWYYLMLAEGGTEQGHMVTMARSRDPYGPYEDCPHNPILYHWRKVAQDNPIQGTGHADLVQAHDGSWWMVNLGFRTTSGNNHHLGRETFLAPVTWDADGWPVVNGNGTESLNMQVQTLPQVSYPSLPEREDFSRPLGPEWIYLCNPDSSNYSVGMNGLRLRAVPGLPLTTVGKTISFVARRQQHIECQVETEITLETNDRENSLYCETGITLYATAASHYDVYLTALEDGRTAMRLRCKLEDMVSHQREIILPKNLHTASVRITSDTDRYTFSYSIDGGKHWIEMGKLNTRYLSSECAGGFTGTVIGLYAVQPNPNCKSRIEGRFSYFDYKAIDSSKKAKKEGNLFKKS